MVQFPPPEMYFILDQYGASPASKKLKIIFAIAKNCDLDRNPVTQYRE